MNDLQSIRAQNLQASAIRNLAHVLRELAFCCEALESTKGLGLDPVALTNSLELAAKRLGPDSPRGLSALNVVNVVFAPLRALSDAEAPNAKTGPHEYLPMGFAPPTYIPAGARPEDGVTAAE